MYDLSPWLGFCHIRKEADDARSSQQTLVAAWADSADTFEREVHFHTNTHGLQMILVEEVLPAAEWLAKHPDRKDAQRLAAKVSAKHPVEIGTLGGGASGLGAGGQPDDSQGYLHIEEIKGVEPLDNQFGVHPPKTVPDELYQPLFGQPDPTRTEVAQYGSADKVPPLHTYAILDAAKVVNFVEMLEASGLEHRCLFKGNAAEEMRDVAPYVVRLEEGNTFTRNLFSFDPEQEVPWFMWSREPGIYVRSRGSLEEMWRHFRKFTKVQDEGGRWYYFRFWEPKTLLDMLISHYDHGVFYIFDKVNTIIFRDKSKVILNVSLAELPKGIQGVIRTSTTAKERYRHLRFKKQIDTIHAHLMKAPQFESYDPEIFHKTISNYHRFAMRMGYSDKACIYNTILGLCLSENNSIDRAEIDRISGNKILHLAARRNQLDNYLNTKISQEKRASINPKKVKHNDG